MEICLKENCDLICLMANWILSPSSLSDEDRVIRNINYWLDRLTPVVNKSKKLVYFAVSNRIGKEKDTEFCGSSSIIQAALSKNIKLLKKLGLYDEGLITTDIYFN